MVTVERVLPWRRERRQTEEQIAPLIHGFNGSDAESQIDVVARAYRMAAKAHDNQRRRSGEPYIVHPFGVARIIADLGRVDEVMVAAALLHDAVEDTRIELEDIRRAFGAEVAMIVDGVTKLDRLRFDSKEHQQAASFRKMLVAMAKDYRVLIIKLCDRLHNLRTIAALPAWKQERTARETLDIYAPLAHRLGMEELKVQLEDLSFAALHPKRYAEIEHMVAVRAPEREFYLTQVLEDVRNRVTELGIPADVAGRDKHLYSIYEKMVLKGKAFDEIHDLVGIRVIVESVRDCYAALGSIHAIWKPVPGRFKDYIAMPKFNLYQSLHTTVVGPQGKVIEVQIRTRDMHERAESGVASHFVYKDGDDASNADLPWLKRIVDWEKETSDPDEFMANLKVDLDQGEVYVFTPQGAVHHAAGRFHPDRLRLRHPHRRRPPLRRGQGRRAAGAAVGGPPLGPGGGDLHLQGGGGGPLARLAQVRLVPAGVVEDQAVVLPGAAGGGGQGGPAPARPGPAPGGHHPGRPEPPGPGRHHPQRHRPHARRHRPGHELRRPGGPAGRHRRQPPVGRDGGGPHRQGAGGGRGPHAAPAHHLPHLAPGPARPRRRPVSGSRATTTCSCGCRGAARRCRATGSWASSPGAGACRCTGPTAPTPSRWRRPSSTA